MAVDLHIHTNASDGSLSPEKVVEIAVRLGLSAISITDHDTVDSIARASEAAIPHELVVVPGIELSTIFEQTTPHILLYFVHPGQPELQDLIVRRRRERRRRLLAILDRLRALDIVISLEELLAIAPDTDAPLGRFHIACAMLERGLVQSIPQAFEIYLGDARPAYLPITGLEVEEVVELTRRLGAVSSLAHPGPSIDDRGIERLAALGVDGIEVISSKHSPGQRRHYLALARRLGLVITGGSDCHGPSSGAGILLGQVTLEDEYWRELLSAAAKKGVDDAHAI